MKSKFNESDRQLFKSVGKFAASVVLLVIVVYFGSGIEIPDSSSAAAVAFTDGALFFFCISVMLRQVRSAGDTLLKEIIPELRRRKAERSKYQYK